MCVHTTIRDSYSDSDSSDFDNDYQDHRRTWPTAEVAAYLSSATSAYALGRRFPAAADEPRTGEPDADDDDQSFFAVVMAEQYNVPIPGGLNRLDVLLTVFSFLPPGTAIVRCAAVCGAWRHVIRAVPQWEMTTTLLQYHGYPKVGPWCRTLDAFRENGRLLLKKVARYRKDCQLDEHQECRSAFRLRAFILIHGLWYVGVFLAGLWAALAMASLAQSTDAGLDDDLKLGVSVAFLELVIALSGCLAHACFMKRRCGASRWSHRFRLANSRTWPLMTAWLVLLLPPVGTVMSLAAARAYSLELIGATPVWFAGCPTTNEPSSQHAATSSLLPLRLHNIFTYGLGQGPRDTMNSYGSSAPISTSETQVLSRVYIRDASAWSVVYDEHIGLARGNATSAAVVTFIALVPSDGQRRRCNAQPVLVMSKAPSDDAAYFRKLASGSGSDVLLMTGLPDRFHGAGTDFASLEPLSPGMTYADVRQTATAYYGGEFTYLSSTGSEPVRFPWYLAPENVSTANWTLPHSVALWSPAAPASLRIPMAAGRAVPILDIAGERDRLSAEVVVLFFVSIGIVFLLALIGWLPIDCPGWCCELCSSCSSMELKCVAVIWLLFGVIIAAPLTLTVAAGICAWTDSNRCYVKKDVAQGLLIAGIVLFIIYGVVWVIWRVATRMRRGTCCRC